MADPVQATPEEGMVGDDALAPLMRVASSIVLAVGLLITLLLLTEDPIKPFHVVLNACAAGVGLLGLMCLRWGRVRWAGLWLIWGTWGVTIAVAWLNGGVRGPNLLSFPVMIVFCGWVLGARSTRWLTAMISAYLVVLLWLDAQGVMPSTANYGNRWAYGTYLIGIVSLTAYMTLKSRRSYLARLSHSERMVSELAAHEHELTKLLRAVEQSPEAVVITDCQQRIEFVNEAFVRRSGYARESVLGHRSCESSTNGMAPDIRLEMDAALLRGDTWSGELTNRRPDGSAYVESVQIAPVRQPDGRISHRVELKQDLTARQQAEAEIHRLAHFDSLTGLPNRSVLIERLEALRGRTGRDAVPHALLMFNLARFKTFNDARGNDMGDSLLRAVARRLLELVPPQGLLVRQGGDEFAIVLPLPAGDSAAAARHALAFAEAVHHDLRRPMRLETGGDDGQTTACAGITLYPQGADDAPGEALRRVGTALHEARSAGPGRTAFFEPGMAEAAEARFRVERELRHAIQSDELVLYLQPQVDGQGLLCGAEALVRWQHPQLGLLLPGRFIPIAEESDLIVALGDWVLEEAMRWLASEVHALPAGFRLSVNLSPRQFSDPGFVRRLRAALASSGADPRRLTLEVTEGVVIGDIEEAIVRMRELASLGIEFSLDDFGTGYSSLIYLKRLPIQEIKIDKSFVQDAPVDEEDGALVESILSVAHRLHLRVVAEGVETREQAHFLAQHSPSVVYQGYLMGRPSPAQGWHWPPLPH